MESGRRFTVGNSVDCKGCGLHSGHLVGVALRPAPSGYGVVFVRVVLGRRIEIPARFEFRAGSTRATTIARDGVEVATIEHLLASIASLGIDDLVIEVDGAELPVFDGSASHWVELLGRAGRRPQAGARSRLVVERAVAVEEAGRRISVVPAKQLDIDYTIDFPAPVIGRQRCRLTNLDAETFAREIAPARTFGFLEEVDRLRAAGLARGANLDNTLVVDGERVLNPGGLLWPDEFVRHKVLDLVSDLALLGTPIQGRISVECGGHRLHHALIERLIASPDAWRIES